MTMIRPEQNQKPTIIRDDDRKGTYHLIGIDYWALTDEDEKALVSSMNALLPKTEKQELEAQELRVVKDEQKERVIAALLPIARAYPDDPGTTDLYDEQPVSIKLGDVRRVWSVLFELGLTGKEWRRER